ncbi:MAG: VanW family protein [Eubacteriales bacterium]|nr:VanW family protein [Eubacteriales bacterium]
MTDRKPQLTRGRQNAAHPAGRNKTGPRLPEKNRQARRKAVRKQRLLLGGSLAFCLLLTAAIVRGCRRNEDGAPLPGGSVQASSEPETSFSAETLLVNGVDLSGMTRSEAREALLALYPWNISVSYDGETKALPDLVAPALDAFLDRLCSDEPSGEYTFSPTEETAFAEAASATAETLAAGWDRPAVNSSISGYDAGNDKFTFSDGTDGLILDQEKLVSDLTSAVSEGQFNTVLTASFRETKPELSAEEARAQYQLLATFTTETTDNARRNTNVRLAAEALNGTIVKSGAEFSFNDTVGERTAEKGYQEAAAYNSGEVVQEIGGGVCQISSTLYHTAFQAGMQITYRRSHTFEPNYVTPGQDAAISWGLPDFRFINTSKAAIGIRASYENRKATVAIYGVPVLEEGVTLSLDSEKTGELPPPEPSYIEDQTLQPGEEVIEKSASNGSHWVTYRVVSKDGVVTERVKDHEKTYKGHATVIRRNTSGVVLTPEETEAQETTTAAAPVDGMPDDYVPGESVAPESSAPAEPPAETSAEAPAETPPHETSEAASEETPAATISVGPGTGVLAAPGDGTASGDEAISELPPEPGL